MATSAARPRRRRAPTRAARSAALGSSSSYSRSTARLAPIPNGRRRPRSSSASSRPPSASARRLPARRRSVSRTTRSRISSRPTTIAPWRASEALELGERSIATCDRQPGDRRAAAAPGDRHRDRVRRARDAVARTGSPTRSPLGAPPRRRAPRAPIRPERRCSRRGPARARRHRARSPSLRSRLASDHSSTASRPRPSITSRSRRSCTSVSRSQHVVLLVDQQRERALGDRDERHLVGHLEQRHARAPPPPPTAPSGSACGRSRCRSPSPATSCSASRSTKRRCRAGAAELDPGGQQELTAREPLRRVLELGDVHPADRPLGSVGSGDQLEAAVGDEVADRQHRVSATASTRAVWPSRSPSTCSRPR